MSQQRKFLTTVAFLAFIGIFNSHVIRGQQFNLENINLWADQIGNELNRIGYEILDLNKIENIYQKQDLYVQNLNGSFLIQQLARNLRETFSTKVAALQNLVDAVQILANDKLTNLTELRQLHYYDSLSSNITSELTMTYSTKFKTLINSSLSVIQIPTNVYSGSRSILATIEYTKNLNDYFIENYNNDPNLRNQYFGGNDGVFRTFPGRPWPKDESGIVLYDCRQRGWYILGSDSPKNVIILIDRSGSMRGMPLAIAKWGTSNLLDTLNQNDFFTILTFNESITPVIDCYTNLIQATDENKKLYKTYLEKFTDGGRADFNHSYAMAFDLLQNAKTQSFRHSAKCQEAIVLFTDGAAQYTEKLLAERNSEKKIRIITFVVGPQFYDTVPIEKLTCEYNGFLGKIPSMGEVGDAIRQYTEVMNRPLLNDKNHPVKWTSVYWDKLGMGLVTTAVMPAFRFNLTASLNPEQLLGVMATDVPIEMFQQCVPQHLLLPNGYAFVIDNNGLVLFHPGIRATLRKAMIDRLSGSMTMETKLLYRNYEKGQGVVKRMTYHFMPVVNTSYSVAIAIEDNTGIPISNSCYSKGLEYLNNMTKSEITTKILDWLHCHGDNLHQSSKYDKKFSKNCYHEVTGGLIKSKQDFDKYCNQALFKQLLQDAHSVDTLKPPQPALQDDAVANREGICDTFISTFSGLTKYYTLISGQRCCSILGSRQCLEKGKEFEESVVTKSVAIKRLT
ncbi:uncharacterized protein TRIADDRAFT_56910 [Trichoplax adhaerens]|uniref:VWFA domain-containing protein n=1 Tax=Trichoplax adhaerens TaxID=10228 RepID=B3RWW7_TRIAD|nr:hypothetical protein TRIADDRAFT_56910 [Trichoplax adhaerens]EDV24767.1 hypothetical protein TRIADDRAFT_56910 [Trichoplax adhaerens]|eukprot:XP_002112657.1 hypothetical protein TRIADDRAFT_56910 [Trichoplax adhaerens]